MTSSLLTFCAGIILVLSVAVSAHNITYGYIGHHDYPLATLSVVKPSSWLVKQTENVVYPPKNKQSNVILTAVKVIDNGVPKDSSHSRLVKGGPGHRNAAVHLESQRGKALNVTLKYYGRYI